MPGRRTACSTRRRSGGGPRSASSCSWRGRGGARRWGGRRRRRPGATPGAGRGPRFARLRRPRADGSICSPGSFRSMGGCAGAVSPPRYGPRAGIAWPRSPCSKHAMPHRVSLQKGLPMRSLLSKALLALVLLPAVAAAEVPTGWFLAGSDPKAYVAERDVNTKRDGKVSARLASTGPSKGFGTLMQSFDAGEYRGKRLKLSAWVKSKDVEDWAGMWMRVDLADKKQGAFDNMQNRAIKGTKDWTRYDVVLDVASDATAIAFGILVSGEGSVWMNDLQFQVVDSSVPVTDMMKGSANLKKPTNLDFSN